MTSHNTRRWNKLNTHFLMSSDVMNIGSSNGKTGNNFLTLLWLIFTGLKNIELISYQVQLCIDLCKYIHDLTVITKTIPVDITSSPLTHNITLKLWYFDIIKAPSPRINR